jgi:tetratricopeptide (TPR) repeat protein
MTREEERLVRYRQQRSKEAIDLAMQGRWQEAVEVNREIIENFPKDVDAYNRLGRAYMELGQYAESVEAYSQTVAMDPYNAIANRNLRRIADIEKSGDEDIDTDHVLPHHFIEEIGKSGTVILYDLGPKEKRARMVAGDKVFLKAEGTGLVVENRRGEYMGRVEPKTGQRLARLIQGGNQYSATIVKSQVDVMSVIIRETHQDPSQAGKLSFPPKGADESRAYAGDRLLKDDNYDEDAEDDSGYTIIGGNGVEVLSEDNGDADDDTGNEDD